MRIAISMGNTNAAWGLFEAGKMACAGRVPLAKISTLPERIGPASVEWAAVASVVPSRNGEVMSVIENAYGIRPGIAGVDLPVNIVNHCDGPAKVGIDRLLNALAAHARAKRQAIVVDVGTAVTVNAIGNDGEFLGGAIGPGPQTMLNALHARTESLPEFAFQTPQKAIGTNTGQAMRSGAYWGTIGMINMLVSCVSKELGGEPVLFLTGGGAEALRDDLGIAVEYVPFLTLEGVNSLS